MRVTNSSLYQSEEIAMLRKRNWKRLGWSLTGLLLLAATGCHNIVDEDSGPEKQVLPTPEPVFVAAKAGLPVSQAPATAVPELVNAYKTVSRPDVWALSALEQDYDVRA